MVARGWIATLALIALTGCGRLGYEGAAGTDAATSRDAEAPRDGGLGRDGATRDADAPDDAGPLPPEGQGPLSIEYERSWRVLAEGAPVAPLTPKLVGDAQGFEVEPELPPGLALDPRTGVIAGTAPATASVTLHTVTATGFGRAASTTLRLDVRPAFTVDDAGDEPDDVAGDGRCGTAAGACTIRAALQEARQASEPTVVVVPEGTYVVSSQLEAGGDVAIVGAGREVTVLDGGLATRVLKVVGGSTAYVSDVALVRGAASGGSGVEVFEATAYLSNVAIRGCVQAGDGGGGLKGSGAELFLERSVVSDNESDGSGGGLSLVHTTAVIHRTRFEGNRAAQRGGGLWAFGDTTAVTLDASRLSGNRAGVTGGALSVTWSSAAVVTSSIFEGNLAGVSGSVAETSFEISSLSLVHCTLLGSDSVVALSGGDGTRIELRGSVLATGTSPPCGGSAVTSAGGNLAAMDASSCGLSAATGDRVEIDPRLEASTGLPVPGADSPALDALAPPCAAPTDARGLPRPLDGDGDGDDACDIGAIEVLRGAG